MKVHRRRIMKKEYVRGELPRIKVRMGVLPTQVHVHKKVYSRKIKHKNMKGADYGYPFFMACLVL